MRFPYLWSWLNGKAVPSAQAKSFRRRNRRTRLALHSLEDRSLPNGYIATGAGPGAPPFVSIRVDTVNALDPNGINRGFLNVPGSGQPLVDAGDGITDRTSQIFLAYNSNFLGGVSTAAGNFDGDYNTPDSLVTAAGPGGGPHIIVWRMRQLQDGGLVTDGIIDQFMAYDPRFAGGVHVTTGDLDGDGLAELITSPGAGGGPHIKIYSLNLNTNRFELKYQFMAYDPRFAGGVSISSGQGYNTQTEVRQVLNAQLATGNNPFTEISYVPETARPGFSPSPFFDVPLMGADIPFLGNGPSTIQQPNSNPIRFLPYITVASGNLQYLGANLLNNYGNIAYEPNVFDPNNANPPNTQRLVFVSWAANNANIPAWATPNIPYGPFVQISPAQGNAPAQVTVLQSPTGQVTTRNQLVTGAGPGGGPHVKVFDFITDGTGFHLNEQIGFMAFSPNFRGGVNVAIGDTVANPSLEARGFLPNNTDTTLEGRTFPMARDVYNQFTPEITVSMASGGNQTRIFADFNPDRAFRRTSITELDLQPLLISTQVLQDPNNPLGGFFSLVDTDVLPNPIDENFRGQIYTTTAGLAFDTTSFTSLGENVYAAGPDPGNFPLRGPRVRIFNKIETSRSYNRPQDVVPSGPAINIPVDDFQAFTQGFFPGGTGGVAFGFGALPNPSRDIIQLTPIAVNTIQNAALVLPPGVDLGSGGGVGPPG